MNSPEGFGNYVLTERIAIGGMAELFRAEALDGTRYATDICIKRILPHYSEDDAFVKMFIDEATIAAKLDHDNIVKIYDFDMVEDSYYIAMELIHGRDLKQVLELCTNRGTRLTVPMTAYVIAEVCRALYYAHTKTVDGRPLGIIHRDVSPHNVMLAFNGDVKITDFGIAKAASRLTTTRAGTVKGKCAYMSPEQARGKSLDARSDLFSIGILMHEMLTGMRLFNGESDFDILTKVLKEPIRPPGQIVGGVDPEIDRICMKALERDRDDRYPDCAAMERDLTNWLRVNGFNRATVGLDQFLQALFGLSNGALPAVGAPMAEPDMSAIADMKTAMFERPLEPPGPDPHPDLSMSKTMPLDSVDPNSFDPELRQRLAAKHRAAPVLAETPRMVVPAPSGSIQQLAPDDKTAMLSAMTDDLHGAATQGINLAEAQAQLAQVQGQGQGQSNPYAAQAAPPPKKKSRVLLVLLILAVLGIFAFVILAGGGYVLLTRTNHLDPWLGPWVGKTAPTADADAPDKDDTQEAPTVGSLMVNSTPDGASVFINDEEQDGKTPLLIAHLDLNTKVTIRVDLEGYESQIVERTVTRDEDAISITLEKSEGDDDGADDDGADDDDADDDDAKDDDAKDDDAKDDVVAKVDKKVDAPPKDDKRSALDDDKKNRERRRTPKPDTAKGTAFVTINAYPWANAYLDGKSLGRTPIRSEKVSAGSHTVVLSNPDFKTPLRKRFSVKKDEKKTIFHNFK